MELRQLKCFEAVAAERSFTKAAANLFISQSTVSSQVSSLESELGIQLLIRDTHSVKLTQAGAHFYQNLKQILPMLDNAVEEARLTDRTKHYAEKLTLGLPAAINRALLGIAQPILKTKAEYPYLAIDFHELSADQMAQALQDHTVDAVISLEHPEDEHMSPEYFCSIPLAKKKIYIGVSRFRLEFDGLSETSTAEDLLKRYPLNVQATNSGMVQQVYALYRHFGIPPNVQYANSQMKMLMSARIGNGLVLAPEFQIFEDNNQEFLRYYDTNLEDLCLLQKVYWLQEGETEPLQFFLRALKDWA